jgi:hypothetical protein
VLRVGCYSCIRHFFSQGFLPALTGGGFNADPVH